MFQSNVHSPYFSDLFIEVASSRQLRKPANGILCNLVIDTDLNIRTC